LSLISTAFEDLKTLHTHLNSFCSQEPNNESIKVAKAYFMNIDNLKKVGRSHEDFA